MVPKKQTKSTSSWMKIEQCFSRVGRKGLRRVLWEPVRLLRPCQLLPSPEWSLVRSSKMQRVEWDLGLLIFFFFFWLGLKCIFLGRLLPSLLPDLQPPWFCLGEHLGSISWTHVFWGYSLSSSRNYWASRTGGDGNEDTRVTSDPSTGPVDPLPGLSCETGRGFGFLFCVSFFLICVNCT